MIDYAEIRLKELNFETRETIEELIEKLRDDPHKTIDIERISDFLEDFTYEDLIENDCGICMKRTDKCDCSKMGRR